MLGHPGKILVLVGCIHHYKIVIVMHFVDDQVIHRTAIFIAHGAVAGLPVLHDRIIIGQEMIQIRNCVRSLHQDLAHMGDVEKSAACPYSHMFLDHSGLILDRQNVSAELHHLAPALHMLVIQRRFLSFHTVPPLFEAK